MKILLLGYGKEGKAIENYFKKHEQNLTVDILENFNIKDIRKSDYSSYNIIFRSPSVPPLGLKNESSITKYFFDHCPCPIIGVTATKGKGTTCSFIKSLLDAHEEDAYLVGNIGEPAINVLDELKPTSVVVYEMSSFQLWDLKKSPHIAVIGTIEPDHLNVHKDYDEYKSAKANICRYQTEQDYLIYYKDNPESVQISEVTDRPHKLAYPYKIPEDIKNAVKIPGKHNINNAIAALTAVACYKNISPDEYLQGYKNEIIKGLQSFKGLPHRLEFVRELDGIKFYDDNFSTNPASTRVAIEAFPDQSVIPIIGGRDKTGYEDLPEIYEILNTKVVNIPAIILMGESGHELAKRYQDERFILIESLEEAVKTAQKEAEKLNDAIVLMSPSAASFDMFENVYDRGSKYQEIVNGL
ncbi:UDP-N-acetylmuramoyl-L-alanine--D-glutamate ligase [Candidatus Saccharibacteria bacterium]|nr:UDP-N-acetylmuramoyl-L-alanine--D-glutamate ligase [Candidatus Saccharibacteria bacterium]